MVLVIVIIVEAVLILMNTDKNEELYLRIKKKHWRILKAIYHYSNIFNKCNMAKREHKNKHEIKKKKWLKTILSRKAHNFPIFQNWLSLTFLHFMR